MIRHSSLAAAVVLAVACQPVNSETGISDTSSSTKPNARVNSSIKVSCKPFSEPAGILNKGERASIEGSMKVVEVLKDTRNHIVRKVDAVLKVTLIDPNRTRVLEREVAVRGTYEKIRGGLFGQSFEYAIFSEINDSELKEIKIDLQNKNLGWAEHRNQKVSYMTNCR